MFYLVKFYLTKLYIFLFSQLTSTTASSPAKAVAAPQSIFEERKAGVVGIYKYLPNGSLVIVPEPTNELIDETIISDFKKGCLEQCWNFRKDNLFIRYGDGDANADAPLYALGAIISDDPSHFEIELDYEYLAYARDEGSESRRETHRLSLTICFVHGEWISQHFKKVKMVYRPDIKGSTIQRLLSRGPRKVKTPRGLGMASVERDLGEYLGTVRDIEISTGVETYDISIDLVNIYEPSNQLSLRQNEIKNLLDNQSTRVLILPTHLKQDFITVMKNSQEMTMVDSDRLLRNVPNSGEETWVNEFPGEEHLSDKILSKLDSNAAVVFYENPYKTDAIRIIQLFTKYVKVVILADGKVPWLPLKPTRASEHISEALLKEGVAEVG